MRTEAGDTGRVGGQPGVEMTHDDFSKFLSRSQAKVSEVYEAGHKEYAVPAGGSAFANFNVLAKQLSIPVDHVVWCFLQKHLNGILAHINGHRSQRESVSGRIKDAIVYLHVLWGIEEVREEAENAGIPVGPDGGQTEDACLPSPDPR